SKMRHGGFVIHSGETSPEHNQALEFSATLDSNPEFTASVLVAYARAAFKLNQRGEKGAKTAFDIPFAALSPNQGKKLLKTYYKKQRLGTSLKSFVPAYFNI